MKKSVAATVLAMSVLFSACSKKESETTSKSETTGSSSEVTTTTSEKETETSEKPTETSKEETETSEEPTETSKEEPVSYDAPAFKKIDYLSVWLFRESVLAFQPKDQSSGDYSTYNSIEYYLGYCGYPCFGSNAEKLNAAVEADSRSFGTYSTEYLEEKKKEYISQFGTEHNEVEEVDDVVPVVFRADEKITTVYFPYLSERQDGKEVTFENLINYDTATGKKITLSEVVKDKKRFVELAKDSIMDTLTEYDLEKYKEEDVLSFLNSDDVPFTLDYSGITVYFDIGVYRRYMRAPAHIGYIGNEDVFNGEYFDSLPENYVLHLSPKKDFYWDLDGDGKTEKIRVDIDVQHQFYEIGSFSIQVDDQETKVDTSASGGDEIADYLTLVHTNGKDFLYIWTGGEDDSMGIMIYELVGKKAEYIGGVGKWMSAPCQNFNPEQVVLLDEVYAIGLECTDAVYHIDEKGKPVIDQDYLSINSYYGRNFPCLKKDLKVDQINPETLEKTGTITLKAGTSLLPCSTNRISDEKKAYEVLKVIDADSKEDVYVRLDLSFEEDEWEASINGENMNDIFVKVFMGA
ncbi:MAG: hypothetical protein IKG93_05120 [Clostridiales bacterium]|nr:hypothetical protein [Clostridiales bacterium]